MKRIFDFLFSLVGLCLISPVLLGIACWVAIDSKGGVFYKQVRVGKNNRDFYLYKFRTMHTHADKKGLLTVGMRDSRITNAGYYLRKYKLDELPQLFNVLKGEMSLVGPRPEVRKYVEMYTPEQLRVLSEKPGITDWASLQYINENEILDQASNPEQTYIQEIMPHKLKLNLQYIDNRSFLTDLRIIAQTLSKIF